MDDIMSGHFSKTMMQDWDNDDKNLLSWRAETEKTAFEKTPITNQEISEQEFFDNGILMVAFVRAGVELAFDTMVAAGIKEESAYYESLHETPLIANTIARKKLFEMNRIISDTAEYGCYLFNQSCLTLLADFMTKINKNHIGSNPSGIEIDEIYLIKNDNKTFSHDIEKIGLILRKNMSNMKKLK